MKNKINYKKVFAIKKQNEQKILKLNSKVPNRSGIYIFTRHEDGFGFAYIGQAVNLLERTASHLNGYESHIDRSLKTHGLFNDNNVSGWDLNFIECEVSEMNDLETKYVLKYGGLGGLGYQLRNKTTGSQGEGKKSIVEADRKGYRKGVEYGYLKARKEIAKLFEKNLAVVFQGKANKLKERALWKFQEFINVEEL